MRGSDPTDGMGVHEVSPYLDSDIQIGDWPNYQPALCPVCGSVHGTTYPAMMALGADAAISGDLSYRKVMMTRCLSCGHITPRQFIFSRDS